MHISKEQKNVVWAFLITLPIFIVLFIIQQNFEFIGYVVIVLLLFFLLLFSNRYVKYPAYVMWGLYIWGVLHMLGGVEFEAGRVIYTFIIFPIIGEPYNILKYDQVIHAFGFFVATLVMFYVLKRYLTAPFGWKAVGIVVAMAGLGLGAFNEIVEFIMTVVLPNTNVGGYENTALDLVFNFVGALAAVFYLRSREKKLEEQ
jgi:uncharacterized membrane protein YjdF